MAVIKQEVNPTLIPNTTMVLGVVNGVPRAYEITPNEGYVLHDSARDWYETDDPANEVGVLTRGYTTGTASCAASYDFNTVTMIDGYTAVGSREFFARPASEVPDNQIFGVGNNDHEVM